MPPDGLPSYCAALGMTMQSLQAQVATGGGAEAVNKAYRQRALEAHPDKPTGSVDAFRRVAAARDALLRAVARGEVVSSGGRPTAAAPRHHRDPAASAAATTSAPIVSTARRPAKKAATATTGGGKGTNAPPAPFSPPPAEAFAAVLPSGALYVFDVSARAFEPSCLRHRDVVKRRVHCDSNNNKDQVDGGVGVIIGVASNGTVYWWERGSTAATPFGPLTGPKAVGFEKQLQRPPTSVSSSSFAAPPPSSSAAAARRDVHQNDPQPNSGTAVASSHSSVSVSATARLAQLEAQELQWRQTFGAAVSDFYSQAAWLNNLPRYSATDRKYNAAYLLA